MKWVVGVTVLLLLTACTQDGQNVHSDRLPIPDGHQRDSGDGKAWVVLAHQDGEDHSSWNKFSEALFWQGYSTFAFDFQGDEELDRQVLGAVEYVREEMKARYIHVVGASKGCTASLLAAGRAEVDSVTCISGALQFADMSIVQRDLDTVVEPALFIGDPDDAAASDVRTMSSWAPNGQGLHEFPGTGHGTHMFEQRESFDEIFQLIVRFMEQSDGRYNASRHN